MHLENTGVGVSMQVACRHVLESEVSSLTGVRLAGLRQASMLSHWGADCIGKDERNHVLGTERLGKESCSARKDKKDLTYRVSVF